VGEGSDGGGLIVRRRKSRHSLKPRLPSRRREADGVRSAPKALKVKGVPFGRAIFMGAPGEHARYRTSPSLVRARGRARHGRGGGRRDARARDSGRLPPGDLGAKLRRLARADA